MVKMKSTKIHIIICNIYIAKKTKNKNIYIGTYNIIYFLFLMGPKISTYSRNENEFTYLHILHRYMCVNKINILFRRSYSC